MAKPTSHVANIETSARLQRVDQLLADGREYSTWDIQTACNICAVNTVIHELRRNGRDIRSRREGTRCYYHLVK